MKKLTKEERKIKAWEEYQKKTQQAREEFDKKIREIEEEEFTNG